jgi:hypothetical protein
VLNARRWKFGGWNRAGEEAGTVPEKVIVSHRGSRYEIGQGKRYYGIWVTGAPESDPIDRWPETPDGWVQAWTRFVTIETPGTIVPVEKPRMGLNIRIPAILLPKKGADPARAGGGIRRLVAAGLLGLGVILGLAGLFPGYVGGQSLVSQSDQLVPHLLYLAVWAAAAAMILLAFVRAPTTPGAKALPGAGILPGAGAMLGAGLSAVTFGMFLSDFGQVIAGAAAGAGLVLSLLGWLACTAGAVLALTVRDAKPPTAATASRLVRPSAAEAGPLALLVLAAIGTVAAFIPSWDSYTLAQTATESTQTITAGNAFSNPGSVIAGEVAVMVALIAVAVLAALSRPARNGAVLLAGAIVPMAAQGISALIQVSGPTSPAQLNISQAEASALGLTINAGVTPIFWVYCVFVISLVISCAWMLTTPPHQAMPARAWSPVGPLPPHHEMRDQDTRGESDAATADSDPAPGDSDHEHTDAALGNSGDDDSQEKAQGSGFPS